MKATFLALAVVALASTAKGDFDPRYVCSACLIVLGLGEQINVQLKLADSLKAKCDEAEDGSKASIALCKKGVDEMIDKTLSKAVPEEVCKSVDMCEEKCEGDQDPAPVSLFVEWPISELPPQPQPWPTERRLTSDSSSASVAAPLVRAAFEKLLVELKYEVKGAEVPDTLPAYAQVIVAAVRMLGLATGQEEAAAGLSNGQEACGKNVTCHVNAIAQYHAPVKDHDGDFFATEENGVLRGSHWRGVDCNDALDDVYPGRKSTEHPHSVDHNCNGIAGGDAKGSYEAQYCEGTGQRGLIMLGDSATAHFHIPPQWMTAQGWNLNGFKEDALDELDFPHCSWGTGHASLEECPYQDSVADPNAGILSLYTQLRDRNRCNHNDFQNIGVNGARMTSSMGLVEAMARGPELDQPVLVWLTLLGNDVCNGHRGFEHMTPPDTFYEDAMASYNRLDELVPPGSYVVATDLFDGELLYDTMHALQHPLGTTYDGFYDFMNCLEINPCWGWLNSDDVVRKNTTAHAKSLNAMYTQIEEEQDFKNFKLIHFSPDWRKLFREYEALGFPASNLIEKADGFHPSQAANYIFAQQFFKFLEDEHPEAIGPINPKNDEIDALFFSASPE